MDYYQYLHPKLSIKMVAMKKEREGGRCTDQPIDSYIFINIIYFVLYT